MALSGIIYDFGPLILLFMLVLFTTKQIFGGIANPYVPLYDDDKEKERNQGLTQKLQELQASMKHNYRMHRRRTIALLLLSAMYVLEIVYIYTWQEMHVPMDN